MTLTVSSLAGRALLCGSILVFSAVAGAALTRLLLSDSLITAAYQETLNTSDALKAADGAVGYAPLSSAAHFKRGLVYLNNASGEAAPQRLDIAVASFQKACSLSPDDFRIWISLGQALSRNNHLDEARAAFKRALALAPSYYEPHWNYGNFLLRANQIDAAFAEFRLALIARPFELPLIFEYAWNAYHGDVPRILHALDVPLDSKPMLAGLLVGKGRKADGLAIWDDINKISPAMIRSNVRGFANVLIAAREYGAAYSVWNAAPKIPRPGAEALDPEALEEDHQWFTFHAPDAGSLLNNGDFEQDLRLRNFAPFIDWRVNQTAGLNISRDSDQHKAGAFSLRMNFDVPGNLSFAIIEQTVPVRAGANYQLTFSAKTESMTSLSTPLLEVYDPADTNRLRAATKPFPLNTNPWQEYVLEFTAPAGTEMVVVRIVRPACGEPPCPIIGKLWIDDLKLATK